MIEKTWKRINTKRPQISIGCGKSTLLRKYSWLMRKFQNKRTFWWKGEKASSTCLELTLLDKKYRHRQNYLFLSWEKKSFTPLTTLTKSSVFPQMNRFCRKPRRLTRYQVNFKTLVVLAKLPFIADKLKQVTISALNASWHTGKITNWCLDWKQLRIKPSPRS